MPDPDATPAEILAALTPEQRLLLLRDLLSTLDPGSIVGVIDLMIEDLATLRVLSARLEVLVSYRRAQAAMSSFKTSPCTRKT